jgi:hypothetical protein
MSRTDAEGRLVVNDYIISPELFERGYANESGPCACASQCCEGGVYADVKERDGILSHKEMVKKYMDETQTRDDSVWFEHHESDDPDFPSGRCVGTTEYNGKCVFLDRAGHCSLQVAAASEGLDRWAIKPMYCVLYPIEITNGVVSFDDMLQDEQPCCSTTHEFRIPLFRACKDELTYLLGAAGYAQLEEYFERVCRHSDTRLPVDQEEGTP